MGRIIEGAVKGDFHPLVGLRNIGDYVQGKVEAKTVTVNGNPAVTLSLIDLQGSTQKSVSKGVYEEVEVSEGDLVQVIGSVKDLKFKLSKLEIGDIVKITFEKEVKVPKGKMKVFEVMVG